MCLARWPVPGRAAPVRPDLKDRALPLHLLLPLLLLLPLPQGWANHVEGQKLNADGDSFRAKH